MVTSRAPSAAMLAVCVFIIAVSARTAASKRLSDALDVSSLAPSSSSSSASNSLFSSESSLSLSESGLSEESSLFSGSSESSLGSRSGSSESSRLSSTSSGSLSSSSSSDSSSLSSGSSSLSSSSKASSSSLSSVSQSGSSSLSSESSSQPYSSSSSSSSDSSSYSSSSSSSSSPFPQSPVKPTPPPPPPSDPATAGPSQAEKDAALYRNSGLLKGQTIAMNHNQIKSSSEIKNKVAEEIPELADLRRAKEQHQRLSREEKIKEQAEDAIKSAESAQKETARANKRHQFAVQMERKQRDFQNKIKEERVKAHQATKDLNAELNQKIVQQAMFTRATMKQKKISLFNARVAWKEEVKKTAIRFKHMAKRLKVQSESGKYLPITESSFNSSSTLNATSPARFPPVTGNGTATNERTHAATGVRSVPRASPTQQQQQQRGQQQQQRTNQYQRRNYNQQQPSQRQRQNYQQNYRQQPTQQQNQQYYRR